MVNSLVILTGAGVSAESGLGTFRDQDGIWSQVRIEDVATPEAFQRDPKRVLDFYRGRLTTHEAAEPNAAHHALSRLEQEFAGEFLLITQNIDNLHERAGSKAVLHMHGEIRATRCHACRRQWADSLRWNEGVACSHCGANQLRPDVVWFGETPYGMARIEEALSGCDLFVAIGTSGTVYPAAGFVQIARATGARTVEINLEPSVGAELFHEVHCGMASEMVPAWVANLVEMV